MTIRGFDPLIVLALLVPAFYLSIFAHELGHALMGRAVGFVVTAFGVGTGHPFLTLSVRGVRIFFCSSNPFQGLTFWLSSHFSPPRRRLVPFTAGGILANALFAATALVLWKFLPRGQPLWACVAFVNALMALISLVPFRQKMGQATIQSDGWLIVSALRLRSLSPSAPTVIQMTRTLRGLWESIGDERSLRVYLTASAAAWAELGDPKRGAAALAEAQSLRATAAPYLAYGALVRAGLESEAGRHDESLIAVDLAEDCCRKAADPVGLLYVSLYRAQMLVARGDTAEATALLDVLADDPQLDRNAALRIAFVGARLWTSLASPGQGSVDEDYARYLAICQKQPSPSRDLLVHHAVGHFHAARGEWSKAEPAFRAAVAAIHDVATAWSDPTDRSRFVQVQSPCLAEAYECLRMLKKVEEAERMIMPLTSTANLQPRVAAAAAKRDRRFFRIGVWVMLANLVCVVGAILHLDIERPQASVPVVVFIVVLATFTSVGAIYLLVRATIGRLIPSLRRGAGAAVLLLACAPWLMLLLLPVWMLIGP